MQKSMKRVITLFLFLIADKVAAIRFRILPEESLRYRPHEEYEKQITDRVWHYTNSPLKPISNLKL
jgi:hypothetical protein